MGDLNLSSSTSFRYTQYEEVDDKNRHYHFFNAYEQYSDSSNHASLQADGLFHEFAASASDEGMPDPKYDRINGPLINFHDGKTGTFSSTFEFTGASSVYHPSVTVGGKPRFGTAVSQGTFAGKIYEILIFKSEHGGGNILDDLFFLSPFKRRWSNMLYYFQRKYQHIGVKV